MPQSEHKSADEFSKSQLKREAEAMQDIGAKLLTLTKAQLHSIALPEKLREAIEHGHTLKTNEAKRRHMQYIGKIMRNVEIEPIILALKKIQAARQQNTQQFHEIETLRDELIAGDDKLLQAFIDKHPNTDRQHLRQLVRKAQRDVKTAKNTGGSKELFKYLRDLLKDSA
jgi:ribosome-associated protein